MPIFVDTNVLVYARDAGEPAKQPQARAWLEYLWTARSGRLSFQVLQEFYVTMTRKLDPGLSPGDARAECRSLLAWRPQAVDSGVLEAAWSLEDRHSLSFWDALIVAAAQAAGCEQLLSEDLTDGETYGGVAVVNPFSHRPSSEHDARTWAEAPLTDEERAFETVADWGPSEDWSDWADAAG